jgi:hypothetical protein
MASGWVAGATPSTSKLCQLKAAEGVTLNLFRENFDRIRITIVLGKSPFKTVSGSFRATAPIMSAVRFYHLITRKMPNESASLIE